jgi:hypothetical protein
MDNEKKQLQDRICQLEFQNDQLVSELAYVDRLLRHIGFEHGLESVKAAACELAEAQIAHEHLYEDGLPDEPPGLED